MLDRSTIFIGVIVLIIIVLVLNMNNNNNNSSSGSQTVNNVQTKLRAFVETLRQENPNHPKIARLYARFQNTRTLESQEAKTYTIEKGKEMRLCIRNHIEKHKKGHIHNNTNELMFVGIHELAHIMSVSVGHNEEFFTNFRYLLRHAVRLGHYTPINYRRSPTPYCNMMLNENPYFDTPPTKSEFINEVQELFTLT